MTARYLFRMDDITPTMDWGRFRAIIALFRNHNVKPLLGVVPDNRDPSLNREPPHPHFWREMRQLQADDLVDFAQHGYQHIVTHRPGAALLGPAVGIKEASEFAGDPLEHQWERIAKGQQILSDNGIRTRVWMAPNHSFDRNTLIALKKCDFVAITDGIALYPSEEEGLICVPQQTWRPRWMPCGVQTVCLHTNHITPHDVKRLRLFLRRPFTCSRFSDEVARFAPNPLHTAANHAFRSAYEYMCRIKRRRQHAELHRVAAMQSGIIRQLAPGQPQPSHPDS